MLLTMTSTVETKQRIDIIIITYILSLQPHNKIAMPPVYVSPLPLGPSHPPTQFENIETIAIYLESGQTDSMTPGEKTH